MTITEIKGDLFTAPEDVYFCHCISGDYALGAGIAKQFNDYFDMRKELKKKFPIERGKNVRTKNEALLVGRTFNLVTKLRYFMKPTYKTFYTALEDMARQCKELGVKKLAMPKIGCGLDGLSWNNVKNLIKSVFDNQDIEIFVYILK